MDWFACPVNAVRAGHSAVDLRTCTDANYVYAVVHQGVGRVFLRIFVLKRLDALMDLLFVIGSRKLLPTRVPHWACIKLSTCEF